MSAVKVRKPKAKAPPVKAVKAGKKNVIAQKLYSGKGWKFMPGQKKILYTTDVPATLPLHDAGLGAKFAGGSPVALTTDPLDEETELADQLVAEVAESGSDVRALCETYELRREELGRLTGFSLRALAEWSSGKLPSQPAKRRLHEVRRLLDALSEIVKRENIKDWLHRRNEAFDNLTPLQVIEVGEMDRLWAMVHDLASGQPT